MYGKFETQLRAHEHPGILTLHRVLEHEDLIVLVLYFVDGGDLLDAITQKPDRCTGNEHQVRSTFAQMLQAVKNTHDVGAVHRDLKLENLLIFEDFSKVYLANFGLATTSRVYERVGSLPYIPPGVSRLHLGHESHYLTFNLFTECFREHVHSYRNAVPNTVDV